MQKKLLQLKRKVSQISALSYLKIYRSLLAWQLKNLESVIFCGLKNLESVIFYNLKNLESVILNREIP